MDLAGVRSFCEKYSDGFLSMTSVTDARKISDFYSSYRRSGEVPEFLYVPDSAEVEDDLSRGMVYLGIINSNNEIVAMQELFLLTLSEGATRVHQRFLDSFSSFAFYPPAWDKHLSEKYFAVSGVFVDEKFRGIGLASKLLSASIEIAQSEHACGIYGDPNYKNLLSQHVISKAFDIIGFTDGSTSGVENEESIYITYYHSFSGKAPTKMIKTISVFSSVESEAKNILISSFSELGSLSHYNLAYKNGINIVHVLDDVVLDPKCFNAL